MGPSYPDPHTQALVAQEASAGSELFAQKRFREALVRYVRAGRLWPGSADLQFNVASAAWAANELRLVQPHLARAIELDPRHALSHDALGRWYQLAGDVQEACRHSEIAVAIDPANAEFRLTRATAIEAAGEYDSAMRLIETLLDDPATGGRAAAVYAELAPRLGLEQRAAGRIEALLRTSTLSAQDRRHLHFSAATLFDRLHRYDDAFEQARLGHQAFAVPYDRAQYDKAFNLRIGHATRTRLASLAHASHGNRRPVFIVGMPRSGTSLIEQILACHPEVHAAGELDALTRTAALLDSGGVPYPQSLDRLTPDGANRLAAHYLAAIEALGPGATYVTDKMPLNFMYLDLIELLLPQSRIIHCTRDPLDTCLSCYMTSFMVPQAFAGDLPALAHFYRNYRRAMEHWKTALTIPMLEIRYEDVVADAETQTRRLLEFLDLPWDERCLRFHENKRPVATASRDQVRRPLYSSSVGRWKHYERHLAPLAAMLASQSPEGSA